MSDVNPQISDEAVEAKTGKDWSTWFEILDAAQAQQMSHKEIVAFLDGNYQVGPWWRQMVTVTYEQARGLREKHEKPTGYQISRSRTLAAPVERLFDAWQDPAQRASWLPAAVTIRKSTPNRSLRITWEDGTTDLDVMFYPKGEGKTQVNVQHNKLPDADHAEQMKEYWASALERLAAYVKA